MSSWIYGLVGGLLVGSLAACGQQEEKGREGGAPRGGRAPGAQVEAALPVKTVPVIRGEITSYVETHARLEAQRWVEVVSRVQGLAEVLRTEEGDQVLAGQILLNLEKEELLLQAEKAKVGLRQVQATFERTRVLHERRMVSQQEFENARNQFENAEVALREVELRLEYADIRAPIDGVLMQRHVEEGELVRTNQVVFVIADLEPLQIRVRVPEKRMIQVRVGQEARITVDPVPDHVFQATVRMINPGIDPASGTVKVTLDVPSGGVLRPGMFATVRIITDSRDDALIVPKKALLFETDEDDLFVVRDGRGQRIRVVLGYTDGDRVEIVSGLREGDQVITVGHEGLKDNAAVRIVGAELETTPEARGDPEARSGAGSE